MSTDDLIKDIQRWYHAQCDGDWEHDFGITIESLDNPGWRVQIDLTGTMLNGKDFEEITRLEPEIDWLHCKIDGNKFIGAGGPFNLDEILRVFLDWAKS